MEGVADEPVVLAWEPGETAGLVNLVVSESLAEELLADLVGNGMAATPDPRPLRGAGAEALSVVVAVAENPAAWAAIGLAVKAFVDRHKGKKVVVDADGETELTNYSARDIERIIRTLSLGENEDKDEPDR